MTLRDLAQEIHGRCMERPDLHRELAEIFSPAKAEVEDGGSEAHEVDLAREDIRQLVEGTGGKGG